MVYLHNGILHTCEKEWDSSVHIDMIALQNILWTEISKVQIIVYSKFAIETIHTNILINTWNISGRLHIEKPV